MSFTFTPALPPSESEERSQHLLDIGKKCSLPSCNLVDFLPFKCQHCAHHYCGEHFLPKAHTCEKWDERQWDRIVPNCPLCNEPVAIPPGQDPNIRMEEHISSKCSVMLGTNKSTKYSGPTCANQRCRKTLFPAIRCDTCKQHFCAAHRFSEDHTCVPPAPSTSTSPPSAKKLFSNLKLGSSSSSAARPGTNTNNKSRPGLSSAPSDVPEYLGAKAAAASAAIKRSIASAASPPPSKAPTSNGTSNGATANTKPAVHNPFSKVDRKFTSSLHAHASLPTLLSTTTITTTPTDSLTPIKSDSPTIVTLPHPMDSVTVSTTINLLDDPFSFIPRSIFATA